MKRLEEVEYIEIEKNKLITIFKNANGFIINYLLIIILCFVFGFITNNENFYLLIAIFSFLSLILNFIYNKLSIKKFY